MIAISPAITTHRQYQYRNSIELRAAGQKKKLSTPAENTGILLARDYKKLPNKNQRCKALAKRLGLHKQTIWMISDGGYCGKRTADRLQYLVDHPRIRKPAYRVYTAYDNEMDAKSVTSIPAPTRRDALLRLARERE